MNENTWRKHPIGTTLIYYYENRDKDIVVKVDETTILTVDTNISQGSWFDTVGDFDKVSIDLHRMRRAPKHMQRF